MARGLVIEEESGTCSGWVHPHNGYYAGSFSTPHPILLERRAAAPRQLRAVVAPQVGTGSATTTADSWPEAA